MRKRFGKQEVLAVVLILGSAILFWMRGNSPAIVFASPTASGTASVEKQP